MQTFSYHKLTLHFLRSGYIKTIFKTAKLQNGEITKQRLQQNDDCYKTAKLQTATVTKERKNGDFYKTAKNNIL